MGALEQYFLHSNVETAGALAVTGAAPPDDEAMLGYLPGLITADP